MFSSLKNRDEISFDLLGRLHRLLEVVKKAANFDRWREVVDVYLNFLMILSLDCAVVAIPLLILACFRKSCSPLVAGGFLMLAICFDTLCLLLPREFGISSFHWNWEGKILSSIWPLIVVYGFKWLTAKEVGLNLPDQKGWLLGLGMGVFFVVWNFLDFLVRGDPSADVHPNPAMNFMFETLLYQFTMPGLAEELVVRGVYLAILNHYLGRQWRLFGASFGWGAILVTVSFIMSHIVFFSPTKNQLIFNIEWLDIQTILLCFSFVYVREKTGSVWPCVLFHNLTNVLSFAFTWVLV